MVKRARSNRRGVALLLVLGGLALMTMIVVDLAAESGLGFVSAAHQSNELRAYYLARSAIGVGLALLAQSARIQAMSQSQQIADTLQDVWPVPAPALALEGGLVNLSIVEARKVNINLLITYDGKVNPQQGQILERLFTIPNVNPQVIPALPIGSTPIVSTRPAAPGRITTWGSPLPGAPRFDAHHR